MRVERGGSFKRLWLIHDYSWRPDIALASILWFKCCAIFCRAKRQICTCAWLRPKIN